MIKSKQMKDSCLLWHCATVMTEENESDSTLRDFKAESPDEAA